MYFNYITGEIFLQEVCCWKSAGCCWKSAGCCWKLLDVVGTILQLAGCCWNHTVTCWKLLEVAGCCWNYTVSCWKLLELCWKLQCWNIQQCTVCFQQLPCKLQKSSNNIQQLPTTSSNFQQHPADFQQVLVERFPLIYLLGNSLF